MIIDKNTFIEILSLPEWDERILSILEYMELERPLIVQGEIDCFRTSEKYGIQMLFDDMCKTEIQKEMENEGNLYLNQISFSKDTPFILPFDLTMKDNYDTVISKIGKVPDKKSRGSDTSFRWDIEDDNKQIRFVCEFNDNHLNSLQNFWMDLRNSLIR